MASAARATTTDPGPRSAILGGPLPGTVASAMGRASQSEDRRRGVPRPVRAEPAAPEPVRWPWSRDGALTMQRLAGNRAVGHLASRNPTAPAAVQRKAGDATPSTRAAAAQAQLSQRWGVRTIRAATLPEQAAELIRVGTVPRTTAPADVEKLLTAAGWASWAPADDHALWDDLVKAFADVGGAFGGVPQVERILFFQTAYKYDTSNRARPSLKAHTKEGAYVSGTTMGVNEHGSKDTLNLPTATTRSKEGKKGINVGVASRVQVMTHELGHGLVQAFLSEDPMGESERFAKTVGWHQHTELYDVQGPGVRDALARGDTPDAAQRIGEQDWYLPKWKEQPPSRYAVTDGPAEDMAETLMMFVRAKSTLGARSPARLAWAERVMTALKARPGSLRKPVTAAAKQVGGHKGG